MEDVQLNTGQETAAGKKKARAAKKPPAVNKNDKHAYMYLGPNISGGILFNGSLQKEMPEHLTEVFKKLPELRELFIEVKDVPRFKREMAKQGSEAYRLVQSVESQIKNGVLRNGK
jgi:hypothetical protein